MSLSAERQSRARTQVRLQAALVRPAGEIRQEPARDRRAGRVGRIPRDGLDGRHLPPKSITGVRSRSPEQIGAGMPESRKVEFPGATGAMLAARLDLPAEPRAFALFAHCFTCGKDIFAASRIAEGLAARDIAVLRFDFTGIGSSEGEFANTNFSSNVGDLVAVAYYLRQNHGPPSMLIGHSLGGAAVLAAAPHVPDATTVVTIGAPAS